MRIIRVLYTHIIRVLYMNSNTCCHMEVPPHPHLVSMAPGTFVASSGFCLAFGGGVLQQFLIAFGGSSVHRFFQLQVRDVRAVASDDCFRQGLSGVRDHGLTP